MSTTIADQEMMEDGILPGDAMMEDQDAGSVGVNGHHAAPAVAENFPSMSQGDAVLTPAEKIVSTDQPGADTEAEMVDADDAAHTGMDASAHTEVEPMPIISSDASSIPLLSSTTASSNAPVEAVVVEAEDADPSTAGKAPVVTLHQDASDVPSEAQLVDGAAPSSESGLKPDEGHQENASTIPRLPSSQNAATEEPQESANTAESDGVEKIVTPPVMRVTFDGHDFVLFATEEAPIYIRGPSTSSATAEPPKALRLEVSPSLYTQPFEMLFEALRMPAALGEFLAEENELVVDFPDFDLRLSEDNVYAREVTLQDMITLHELTGLQHSLHLAVSEAPRFITRYNSLIDQPKRPAVNGVQALEAGEEEGAGVGADEVEADEDVDHEEVPDQPGDVGGGEEDETGEAAANEDGQENAAGEEEGDQTFLTVAEGSDEEDRAVNDGQVGSTPRATSTHLNAQDEEEQDEEEIVEYDEEEDDSAGAVLAQPGEDEDEAEAEAGDLPVGEGVAEEARLEEQGAEAEAEAGSDVLRATQEIAGQKADEELAKGKKRSAGEDEDEGGEGEVEAKRSRAD